MLEYMLVWVQVEGVPSYNEDQVAFVVDNPSTSFSIWVSVVLGTLAINHVLAAMKESEMNNDPFEWLAYQTSSCAVLA